MSDIARRAVLLLPMLLAACTTPSDTSRDQMSGSTVAQGVPVQFGTTYQLPSLIYGMPREINVYIPTLPAWGETYFNRPLPILYVIDGGLEQDFFHIAGLSQLTLINGERQPAIVVGVRTHDRRPEISPVASDPRYLANGFEGWGGSATFRRHLLEEVKPFVATLVDGGRHTLMGESLAGLFVVETFLQQPEAFDDYVAISPSLWWDDRRLSKQASSLLQRHAASDRRLYLTMADEGGTMRLGLDEVIAALADADNKVTTKFVDRADSDSHSSIYHHAARDALLWLHGIAQEPYGDAPWYLQIDGQPPVDETQGE